MHHLITRDAKGKIRVVEMSAGWDENGVKFYVNTPEDLWKIVEQHQLDYSVEETCDTKSDIS